MKKKKTSSASPAALSSSGANASWFEYVFPLLPFLALIPNFFIIPSLTYAGLATQEVGFAIAVTLCAVIGLAQAWRGRPDIQVTRQSCWLFAPLALFVCWQALSLTWATERGEALRQLGFWFGFLVFATAAWKSMRARAAWQIYYALLLLAAVLALSLWLEYRAYGSFDMQGMFFNHGITAELLALLWPLFACVFLFEKNRGAVVIAALATVFTTAALMLTLRRGPLLGIVVASVLILAALLARQMKVAERWRATVVILMLLLIVLPLAVIKREAILSRLR